MDCKLYRELEDEQQQQDDKSEVNRQVSHSFAQNLQKQLLSHSTAGFPLAYQFLNSQHQRHFKET